MDGVPQAGQNPDLRLVYNCGWGNTIFYGFQACNVIVPPTYLWCLVKYPETLDLSDQLGSFMQGFVLSVFTVNLIGYLYAFPRIVARIYLEEEDKVFKLVTYRFFPFPRITKIQTVEEHSAHVIDYDLPFKFIQGQLLVLPNGRKLIYGRESFLHGRYFKKLVRDFL